MEEFTKKLNKECAFFTSDCCKNFVIAHKTAKLMFFPKGINDILCKIFSESCLLYHFLSWFSGQGKMMYS